MSGAERYLTQPVEEAIGRLRDEMPVPFLDRSPVYDVLFVAANTTRDIQHGMGTIPTGVVVLAAVGGAVRCSDLSTWTRELAFLEADTANTRARIYFVLMEAPRDA